MNRCLVVVSLGWTVELVLKPLVEASRECDVVEAVFIVSKPLSDYAEKRLEEVIGLIKTLLTALPIKYDVGVVDVNSRSLEDIIALVLEKVQDRKNEHVLWFVAGGGQRVVAIAVVLSGILAATILSKMVRIYVVNEETKEMHKLDIDTLLLAIKGLGPTQLQILSALTRQPSSYSELARELSKDEVTIRRIIAVLKAQGLVECERRGRRVECKASNRGKTLARILGMLRDK